MGSQVFISLQLGRLAAQAATVKAREGKEQEVVKKKTFCGAVDYTIGVVKSLNHTIKNKESCQRFTKHLIYMEKSVCFEGIPHS